jgi:hypothetical protein
MSDQRTQDDGELTTADLVESRPSSREGDEAQPQTPPASEGENSLFPPEESGELRDHWESIQARFVDEPRRAVEEADSLVASAIKRVAESFADERARLEALWDQGDSVSTEDLRVALQKYRSFFTRILSM